MALMAYSIVPKIEWAFTLLRLKIAKLSAYLKNHLSGGRRDLLRTLYNLQPP